MKRTVILGFVIAAGFALFIACGGGGGDDGGAERTGTVRIIGDSN
jgi:hypothetical protein